MYIPNSFKKVIKNTFYDKKVEILSKESMLDAEGGFNMRGLDTINSFYGNVSFSNFKKLQEDYGLKYDINISITTDYDGLKINDLIRYKDKIYNITDLIESDSHILIVGALWHQSQLKIQI